MLIANVQVIVLQITICAIIVVSVKWFVSKIMTFKSDAITRAESQRRLNATFEIPIHRELKKQQKEFCKRGGTIKLIFIELEQPTICWDKSGKTITSVKWNHN